MTEQTADASSAFADSLPVTPDQLAVRLDGLGLSYERFSHPPLRTVADSKLARSGMLTPQEGGGHIKNLYLRCKRKKNYLIVLQEDRQLDLAWLADHLGAGRFSFGSAERLFENLGVRPGAVTPLAMISGAGRGVHLVMDSSLRDTKIIYMHPLVNDLTFGMAPASLLAFLDSLDVQPSWID